MAIFPQSGQTAIDNTLEHLGSFTSFAGCDIVASFDGIKMTTMQGIMIMASREKVGSYCFGSADPRNFSRGKRGVAGSLVFGNYDRNALLFGMLQGFKNLAQGGPLVSTAGGYWGWIDESVPTYRNTTVARLGSRNNFVEKLWVPVRYSDQLLPFNITLTGANEYGRLAYLSIRGVEIVNEALALSVDDPLNSQQNTFLARHYIPWQPISLDQGNPIRFDPENVASQGLGLLDDISRGTLESIAGVANNINDIVSIISNSGVFGSPA